MKLCLPKKIVMIFIALCVIILPTFSLEGTVVSSTGKVEVQTQSGWAPLRVGDTVESGLIISTGFRSQAIIQIAGTSIVVKQLSRLTLEQLSETNDTHSSEVFLDLGSISADVQGVENKRVGFVVNTPVATASVRGTGFDFNRAGTVAVFDGVVALQGKTGGSVPVSAGNSSTIQSTGKATKPFTNKIQESLGTPTVAAEDTLQSASSASVSAATTTRGTESTAVTTATVIVTFPIN